jgi:hypothetical protein
MEARLKYLEAIERKPFFALEFIIHNIREKNYKK